MDIQDWYWRLRQERKRLGYTMDSFARVLGVCRSTFAKYEAGKTAPTCPDLNNAAHAGADILYIVTGRRAEENASSEIDWELLQNISKCVDAWAEEMDLDLPAEKKFALMRALYSKFSVSKTVSVVDIQESVKLSA